jgi:hypothetical protein
VKENGRKLILSKNKKGLSERFGQEMLN